MATALDLGFLALNAGPSASWLGAATPPEMHHLLLAAAWRGLVATALTTWAQAHAQQAFAATTAALATGNSAYLFLPVSFVEILKGFTPVVTLMVQQVAGQAAPKLPMLTRFSAPRPRP